MLEFLKFIFSKDFVSNSKDIIAFLKKSKEWQKDIDRYTGLFYKKDKDESIVLIDQTIKKLKEKKLAK